MKVKAGVLLIVIVLLTFTVTVNVVYAYGTCAFCQRILPKNLNWAFSSVGTMGLRDGSYEIEAEVDEYKSKAATFILGTTLFTYVSDGGAYLDSGSAYGFVGGYDIIFDVYRTDTDSDSN